MCHFCDKKFVEFAASLVREDCSISVLRRILQTLNCKECDPMNNLSRIFKTIQQSQYRNLHFYRFICDSKVFQKMSSSEGSSQKGKKSSELDTEEIFFWFLPVFLERTDLKKTLDSLEIEDAFDENSYSGITVNEFFKYASEKVPFGVTGKTNEFMKLKLLV